MELGCDCQQCPRHSYLSRLQEEYKMYDEFVRRTKNKEVAKQLYENIKKQIKYLASIQENMAKLIVTE
jgi:hypothetical protein